MTFFKIGTAFLGVSQLLHLLTYRRFPKRDKSQEIQRQVAASISSYRASQMPVIAGGGREPLTGIWEAAPVQTGEAASRLLRILLTFAYSIVPH